jgi:hypothetical protein
MSALSLPARLSAAPREALLRLVLKLDAIVTGANGVAYLAAAEPLDDLFGVDPAVQRPIGAFLVLFAAAVWVAATRPTVSRRAVLAVAAANALWVMGSLVFVAAGARGRRLRRPAGRRLPGVRPATLGRPFRPVREAVPPDRR